MRVLVASDFEPGSHRAHAINVVKTAGGFARLGHDVTVLCRGSGTSNVKDRVCAYGEPQLAWECVPFDMAESDVERERTFARATAETARRFDFVYARHFFAALTTSRFGIETALETHAYVGDPNPLLQRALEATRTELTSIVTISEVLRAHYVERGGDPARIVVVPDGVDVARFRLPDDTGDCPFSRRFDWHVLYAGHLYDYKGIPTVLGAAARLPNIGFEIVGGSPEDVDHVRFAARSLDNVTVHGLVPHDHVPQWLWHADTLLLPPSATEPSARWTSPVKLGEYLASTKPIVASSIPGLRAWVAGDVVTWFRPDDPGDMARAIVRALGEDAEWGSERRRRALQLADSFDYRHRARKILASSGQLHDSPSCQPCSPISGTKTTLPSPSLR